VQAVKCPFSYVVHDGSSDPLKAGLVMCDPDGGCGAEGMADHGDFGQMDAVFYEVELIPLRPWEWGAYGAFEVKVLFCQGLALSSAYCCYCCIFFSHSARRISICALRNSLSIQWAGEVSLDRL
jgi:hypothetical protein